MSLPDAVQTVLGDEPALDRIVLTGEDELIVTPTRSLRYHAEGILNDESVEEFPHGAERLSVSTGRRTARISLEYGPDGERTLSVPAGRLEDVLHSLLAGILSATGITDPDERAIETFRFNELTVVVTAERLIEHVGEAVWDGEFETIEFADATGITVEQGSVATGIVLTAAGRRKRIKVPNERARVFEECVRKAIREHHGIDSVDELEVAESVPVDPGPAVGGVEPLALERPTEDRSDGEHSSGSPESNANDPDPITGTNLEAQLDRLVETVEKQEALLARQRRTIGELREALTR